MNVAVIIPAYKEAENIEKLVKSILEIVEKPTIIIVDDSPNNEIESIIKPFENIIYLYRGRKLGRGTAVIEGMKTIIKLKNIDKIIEMDADLSHEPKEIKGNLEIFSSENLDLLISSRYLKQSKIINWSYRRKIFSFLANKLAKLLLEIPVTDYTNGFRIYSRKSIEHIILNCGKSGDGFIILSEILVELYFNNFKISETSSVFRNRLRGESSVNFKLIMKSLISLFKIYKRKRILLK